jgi:hypothetical protein
MRGIQISGPKDDMWASRSSSLMLQWFVMSSVDVTMLIGLETFREDFKYCQKEMVLTDNCNMQIRHASGGCNLTLHMGQLTFP